MSRTRNGPPRGEGEGGDRPRKKRRRLFSEIPEDADGLLELSAAMLEGWEQHKDDPGLKDTDAGRELAAMMEEVRQNAATLERAADEAKRASAQAAAACSALWAQRRGIKRLVERHYSKPKGRPGR